MTIERAPAFAIAAVWSKPATPAAIRAPTSPEGERRNVSVLFADAVRAHERVGTVISAVAGDLEGEQRANFIRYAAIQSGNSVPDKRLS